MANIIVVSPSQSTEAGSSGDLIVFRSGAVNYSTVVGGTGADTIEVLDGTVSAFAADISLKGGADKFTQSGVVYSGSTLLAGAGGDTVALTGTDAVLNTIKGGDGSDVIELHTGSEFSSVLLGAGADLISGVGDISAETGFIGLGAGTDTLTLSAARFQEGTIKGGGGSDLINLDVTTAGEVEIYGDATGAANEGADTINITATLVSGTIKGNGGADIIKLNGTVEDESLYEGNAGADHLNFSAATFVNVGSSTLAGGSGNDTLEFGLVGSAGSGALLFGGDGDDSIILDAEARTTAGGGSFSAGQGYATIAGGGGADSIYFSAAAGIAGAADSAGYAGLIAFSSNSDSTESQMDLITFNATAGAANKFLVDGDFTGVGNGKKGGIDVSAGVMRTAGGASSISDRISAIDSVLVTGQAAVFTDASASAAYLFVQGGSTDMVAKFSNSNAKIGTAGSIIVTDEVSGFVLEL